MFASDDNPYASPLAHLDSVRSFTSSNLKLQATCEQRSWLGRTIVLTGDVNARIRYLGWTPGESVYVDDVLVGKCKTFYITAVAPRIDFNFQSHGKFHSASVMARASYLRLFRLVAFKLVIDDHLVYEE